MNKICINWVIRLQALICIFCLWVSPQFVMAENQMDYTHARVNTESRLNVRSGPGTSYEIVGKLNPGDVVPITSTAFDSEGWLQIETEGGMTGYVSKSHVLLVDVPESQAEKTSSYGEYSFMVFPPFQWYYALYCKLLTIDPVKVVVFIVLVFLIELVVIWWMRAQYYPKPKITVAVAYLLLLIFAALTVPGMFIYDAVFHHRGVWAIVLYMLMLLSTGCAMLHAAWRIKLSGMYLGLRVYDDSLNYQIGRWVGNILWFFMLIPFAKIWWDICDSFVVDLDGGFWTMLFTLLVMGGLNWLVARWVWPFGMVQYLFHTANQSIVYIMTIVLVGGMLSCEYDVLYASFDGIVFLLSILLGIPLVVYTIGIAWNSITEYRCGNCHSFNTRQNGFTDMGYRYRTSSEWRDLKDSSVKQRISGSIINNPRGLVRTTEKISKWRTHHICNNCRHAWDMDHEMVESRSSRTVRKEWEEWY